MDQTRQIRLPLLLMMMSDPQMMIQIRSMVEICVYSVFRVSMELKVPVLAGILLNPQGHFQDCALIHWEPTSQSRSAWRTRNPHGVLLTQRQIPHVSQNPRRILSRNTSGRLEPLSRIRMVADTSQSRNLFGGIRSAIWWLRGSDAVLWSAGCVVGNGGLCRVVCSMLL